MPGGRCLLLLLLPLVLAPLLCCSTSTSTGGAFGFAPTPAPHHHRHRRRRPHTLRMVEGHGVARVAAAHRKLLLNHAFKATSPNGRFTEGARLVNNRRLSQIQNIGKNLFYFFERTPQSVPSPVDPVVVHIHFGMSGAFTTR